MFREKVRKQMQEQNLKVEDVASKAGIPTASLYTFLNGSRTLSVKYLDKLFHVIGLSLQEKDGFTFDENNVPKY